MCQALIHLVGYFYVVGAGLWRDGATHHRLAVAAEESTQVFGRQFGVAQIAESDETAALLFDNELIKFFRAAQSALCAHGEFRIGAFHHTGGQFYIFSLQC